MVVQISATREQYSTIAIVAIVATSPPIPIAIPFSSPHQYNTIAIPIAIYYNIIYCSLALVQIIRPPAISILCLRY